MAQTSLNLSKLSIAELLQSANNIKTAMTGNATFPTPFPPLTEIGTLITGLEDANDTYQTSVNTTKQNLTLRDDAAAALINGLTSLAGHVQSVSGGDPAKIQSAGMAVKGARTPTTLPTMVSNLAITSGDDGGELDLQWDPVAGAKTYEIQTSPDPATSSSWVAHSSVTKSKAALTGLTSGARLWVRVRAINGAGAGAWSDVATKIVP
jgi:hypothetical protein